MGKVIFGNKVCLENNSPLLEMVQPFLSTVNTFITVPVGLDCHDIHTVGQYCSLTASALLLKPWLLTGNTVLHFSEKVHSPHMGQEPIGDSSPWDSRQTWNKFSTGM